jgi:hypothetical protein
MANFERKLRTFFGRFLRENALEKAIREEEASRSHHGRMLVRQTGGLDLNNISKNNSNNNTEGRQPQYRLKAIQVNVVNYYFSFW